MSRRKQSHPRPFKRKTEDELEELAISQGLPRDIFHVRESEDVAYECTVYSAVALPKGLTFGPYNGRKVDSVVASPEDSSQPSCVLQFGGGDDKVCYDVAGTGGQWIKLIRPTTSESAGNLLVRTQHKQGTEETCISCEITSDIGPNTEIIAMLGKEIDPGYNSYHTEQLRMTRPDKGDTIEPRSSQSPAAKCKQEPQPTNKSPPHVPSEASGVKKLQKPATLSAGPQLYPLLHGCTDCGVRYSSESTLLAHKNFYCTKKPSPAAAMSPCDTTPTSADPLNVPGNNTDESQDAKMEVEKPKQAPAGKKRLLQDYQQNERAAKAKSLGTPSPSSSSNDSDTADPDEPVTKTPKPPDVHRCTQCDFVCHSKSLMDTHKAAHTCAKSQAEMEPVDGPLPLGFLYCRECNIQFSSVSTFQVHKEFYCQQRHVKRSKGRGQQQCESADDEVVRKVEAQPMMQIASSTAAMMPMFPPMMSSPMSLLPPSELSALMAAQIARGSLPPSHPTVLLSTPVMTPSGLSSMAFNVPAIVVQPLASPAPHSPRAACHTPVAEVDRPRSCKRGLDSEQTEQPLDLSMKRQKPEVAESGKHKKTVAVKNRTKRPSSNQHVASAGPISDRRNSRSVTPPSNRKGQQSPGQSSPGRSPVVPVAVQPDTMHPNMKLLPPMPLGLPPMFPPMMLNGINGSPNHVNKCTDCNIVFYKHENYAAHKEHYCASRKHHSPSRAGSDSPESTPVNCAAFLPVSPGKAGCFVGQRSPASAKSSSPVTSQAGSLSPGVSAGPPHHPSSILETAMIESSILQYYCIPCKIKFSSLDTLDAHQKHYCPHRNKPPANDATPGGQDQETSNALKDSDVEDDRGDQTCPHCGTAFTSTRLLKLHYCTGIAVHMPLFRCPYCDYIAQSDSRLIEHIKAHAPSKAFKCTICGYRGNTVRGMRMHGKMHIDAGEKFTDENMMEFEEPPLIPKRLKAIDPTVFDIEAELMHYKNEPYKRRRSKKAYEKHDTPIRRHPCPECPELFADVLQLKMHMSVRHVPENYSCKYCHVIVDSKPSLVHHVKMMHENVAVKNDEAPKRQDELDGEVVCIKEEPRCPVMTSAPQRSPQRSPHPRQMSPKAEDNKQESNGLDESQSTSPRRSPASIPAAHEEDSNDIDSKHLANISSPKTPESQIFKLEAPGDHLSLNGQSNHSTAYKRSPPWTPEKHQNSSANNSPARMSDDEHSNGIICNGLPNSQPLTDPKATTESPIGVKYCNQCDISFTYLSTFIAHKKYYCSSHASERANSIQSEL